MLADGTAAIAEGYTPNTTTLVIPTSLNGHRVTELGSCAFWFESKLQRVVIPDGVTCIGDWAFRMCSNMTSITIPGSVNSIGEGVFSGCSSLNTIRVARGSYAEQWAKHQHYDDKIGYIDDKMIFGS